MADEVLRPGDRVRHVNLPHFGLGTVALDPPPDSPPGCAHIFWDELPAGVPALMGDEPWAHAASLLRKVDQA